MSASAPDHLRSTHETGTKRMPRFWSAIICLALGVATLLLYAPARHFDYVSLDDHLYVDPPQVQRGVSIEGLRWAFTTGHAANWHPVTWLSHMLDAELFGVGPAGPHLVNAVLHAVNAMLVFIALHALTRCPWPSAIVAALFALHPLRVESVAWVAERKDLLAGFFFLLTLIAYGRFSRSGRAVHYIFALLMFTLGLLSKPMLVTLPFVLLLLDLWPLDRPSNWRRLIIEKIPFFALALASSVITYLVQQHAGAMPEHITSPALRIQNAILSYGRYLWKTIRPAKLAVFYPYHGALPGTSISVTAVMTSALILLLVTAGGLWLWRREKSLLVGWLWFVGMLVPVIGLVQVGMQSMADRYTYLPHIGLCVAIVFTASRFLPRRAALAVVPVLIVLMYRTSVQLSTWRDSNTLFIHAIDVTSHNHLAHNNLGYVAMRDGRFANAIWHFEQVIAINPKSPEPHYNIGLALAELGRGEEAQQSLERAIALKPDYVDAHINLANVLLAQQKFDEAIAHYLRATRLAPTSFLAQYNLALAISQKAGDAAALAEFERAVELAPEHAEARYSLALSLKAAGRHDAALQQLDHAARLARGQNLPALAAEIHRQQIEIRALPKPTTNTENHRP